MSNLITFSKNIFHQKAVEWNLICLSNSGMLKTNASKSTGWQF